MTSPIAATLSGTLSGATKQGALTSIPLAYTLDAQSGHFQTSAQVEAGETKVVSVPINLGGPVASPDPQTFLLITSDVANVAIRLNTLGTPVGPFAFAQDAGPLFLPGQVGSPAASVSDVEIVNSGTQRAVISISAIFGA